MIGVNDFWTEPVALPDEAQGAGPWAFVKQHSRLYRGLYILMRRSGATALEVDDTPDSNFKHGEGTIRSGEHEFEVGWTREVGQPRVVEARLRENLNALIALARESSTPLVLMTYPARFRYYSLANPVIRRTARERGIPLIDLERVFEPLCPALECEEWLFPDQHPKPAGYRLVGETIAARLPDLLR